MDLPAWSQREAEIIQKLCEIANDYLREDGREFPRWELGLIDRQEHFLKITKRTMESDTGAQHDTVFRVWIYDLFGFASDIGVEIGGKDGG